MSIYRLDSIFRPKRIAVVGASDDRAGGRATLERAPGEHVGYDREMGIVAEVSRAGERELVGVGRLVTDPDHRTAEFAFLVTDRRQGRGLRALLTEYCLDLAPAE